MCSVLVSGDNWCVMVGPLDLKLRPGDRIYFGSLEFLVGA
jgi:hypothetical protein